MVVLGWNMIAWNLRTGEALGWPGMIGTPIKDTIPNTAGAPEF